MASDFDDFNLCPSCGSIKKESNKVNENITCDCRSQKKLAKIYTRTNIPYEYWFKDLDDYYGRDDHKNEIEEYCNKINDYHRHAIGLFLWGKNGTGKTLLSICVLKYALKKKFECFFVSYSEIVSMFTSTWSSNSAKSAFEKNIEKSDFLVIDDLGKEYKTNNNLAESILDKVIRYRRRPTIITSNKNVEELKTLYQHTWGESLASLIYGKMINVQVMGRDYRKDISVKLKEIVSNETYRKIK